mmetsp:Transcript_41440/g.93745  ORF Transcript_41440/g.93745 Transcript_41440/m.93745 type:complete len:224 (-) Transcript_41440:273-944(-)
MESTLKATLKLPGLALPGRCKSSSSVVEWRRRMILPLRVDEYATLLTRPLMVIPTIPTNMAIWLSWNALNACSNSGPKVTSARSGKILLCKTTFFTTAVEVRSPPVDMATRVARYTTSRTTYSTTRTTPPMLDPTSRVILHVAPWLLLANWTLSRVTTRIPTAGPKKASGVRTREIFLSTPRRRKQLARNTTARTTCTSKEVNAEDKATTINPLQIKSEASPM